MLSFTTIILLLLITIGIYLSITNRVEGKTRIVIIIAVLICLIYVFMNITIFKPKKNYSVDASTITTETNIDTTSPVFSLSTWIYITDWKPGVIKTVFSMTNNDSEYTPKMVLGPHKNELIITYYIKDSPEVKYNRESFIEDNILETIIIPHIKIQKWMNFIISFGVNSVDIYLDGKLLDTHINNGNTPYVTNIPKDTTLNWGGFIGYISKYKYEPKIVLPQDAIEIYKKGF